MRFFNISQLILGIYEAFFAAAENWAPDEHSNSCILLFPLMIYLQRLALSNLQRWDQIMVLFSLYF